MNTLLDNSFIFVSEKGDVFLQSCFEGWLTHKYLKRNVTYSHHLPFRLEVGASYSMALLSQVSISYPRVSRGSFSPGNGCFFFFMSYAAPSPKILFPSFRILTAAFTSRSMIFPQEHIYVRSDSFRSSFIFPQQLQSLLDG